MVNTNKQKTSVYAALTFSLMLHIATAIVIYILDFSLLVEVKKTIPFKLISADRSSSLSNQQSLRKTNNDKAAKEYLATLNDSIFKRTKTNRHKKRSDNQPAAKAPNTSGISSSEFALMGTPIQTQGSNTRQVLQGLQNIFAKKSLNTTHDIIQISSASLKDLSVYEIELVGILAREKKLYDPFHQIMTDNKKDRLNYVIRISLFSNGQIKKALIKTSSGIQEIDQLAKQIAYSVSPYPPPPKQDKDKGYKYDIPLNYQLTFNPDGF